MLSGVPQANGLPCFVSDKVSKECKLSSSMNFISLDKSVDYWSKEILNSKFNRNKNAKHELRENKFDIHSEAINLMNFYK